MAVSKSKLESFARKYSDTFHSLNPNQAGFRPRKIDQLNLGCYDSLSYDECLKALGLLRESQQELFQVWDLSQYFVKVSFNQRKGRLWGLSEMTDEAAEKMDSMFAHL